MKRLLTPVLIFCLLASVNAFAKEIWLSGRVKDAVTKYDLTKAYILLFDSIGNVSDTVYCNQGRRWQRGGDPDTLSAFYFKVPAADSTYVFDVLCEGYKDQTISYTVKDAGKERYLEVPLIMMQRAPHQLKEVTVVSSKIKFYNKGDTVVYNADAFQLAEGSMLDALIAQLPGAELNTDGQIKINGQFVESLLLNGKEFFDNNNNLMLENIAAYTVKDIQVFEGQTIDAKRKNDMTAPKVLTMDVRLKKEYNVGWIVNAQAGYGTSDRYLGRLFANWFNATTRVSFVANVNNLNDNRTPGKSDTWTPEQMPSGRKERQSFGVDYEYTSVDEKREVGGGVNFTRSKDKVNRTTFRTNFLPTGDVYEDAFARNNNVNWNLQTSHRVYLRGNSLTGMIYVRGSYGKTKNIGSALSGSFNQEPEEMDEKILEAIYSGNPALVSTIINRSRTATDSRFTNYNLSVMPYFSVKIPKTSDYLSFDFGFSHYGTKQDQWKDYEINFGSDPNPAERRRRYTTTDPSYSNNFAASMGYMFQPKNSWVSLQYAYNFNDSHKDQSMYALEHLADMGIFGVVPEGYMSVFDPANSFKSRTITNRHSFNPAWNFATSQNKSGFLMIRLHPQLVLTHRNFNYFTSGTDYHISKSHFTVNISSIWEGMVEYQFTSREKDGGRMAYNNSMRYSYRIESTLPELSDMVGITLDSDPLNIYVGNPNLRVQYRHRHLYRWSYSPQKYPFNNIFYVGYTHTSGALTSGYVYDTTTGVRRNKMYNVDGNHTFAITNELSWQFGPKKQYTISSTSDLDCTTMHDMIGVNMSEPEKTTVRNRILSEKLKFSWLIGSQNISLRCDYTNRRTNSTQQGYNAFDAHHLNYGISGVFRLPAGFGASTDFMCYKRSGYGMAQLDKTDLIWNMRITYANPRLKNWVFMLDGFDLLHQLNNVDYTVNESGRMVSYTNSLPRYFLLSVQYRLNIQPKKR